MSDQGFEYAARYRKALALARTLKELGLTAAEVPHITKEQWEMAAEAATERAKMGGDDKAIKPPNSEATLKTIQHILEYGH